MRHYLLVFVLLLSSVFSFAQDAKVLDPSLENIQKELEKQISGNNTENKAKENSLNDLLSKTKDTLKRIEIYLDLCYYCEIKDNLKYADPVVKLCQEKLKSTKDKELRKKLYNSLARAYEYYNYYYSDPQFRNDAKYEHYAKEIVNCYRSAENEIKYVNSMTGLADYYGKKKGSILMQLNTLQEGLKYTSQKKTI